MLTYQISGAILSPAGNSQPGNLTPERKGVKTPNNGVFLCPKKIVTEKIRALTMAARLGPLSSGPVPLPVVITLLNPPPEIYHLRLAVIHINKGIPQ